VVRDQGAGNWVLGNGFLSLYFIGNQTGKKPFIQEFFATQEIPKIKSVKPIELEEILIGGMPSVALRQAKNPTLWFKGYEQTYLERDVREISRIIFLKAIIISDS